MGGGRVRAVAAIAGLLASLLVSASVSGADEPTPGTTRRLGNSTDVIAAAVELSQGTWVDGDASVVALARHDLFPDSLAGAALAGTEGPVLFTTGGSSATLVPAVQAEIQRVLPAPHGCNGGSAEIDSLGGTGAVSPSVESALTGLGYCVRRFGGANRIETAVLIARHVRDGGGDMSQILLSRSDNWPDSATGSAYAAATRHPILVTPTASLDPAVATFLDESNPSEIVLLGGTGALSPAVASQAAAFGATRRVAGASRDATSVAIADQLWGSLDPSGIAIVNGFAANGWAYAIAAAVSAAREGAAELFVDAASIPQSVLDHLDGVDDAFTLVAGPAALVSDDVVADAEATRGMLEPPGDGHLRYHDEVFTDIETTTGIKYGSAPDIDDHNVDLILDIDEPADDTVDRRPLIVWVHGGAFAQGFGDRNDDELTRLAFVRTGYVVASIDYRLLPQPGCLNHQTETHEDEPCATGVRMAIEDAQTAVRFFAANATRYDIDPTRIAIAGLSAGGFTALDVAFSLGEEPDSAPVKAAIAMAGVVTTGITPSAGDAPTMLFHARDDDLVAYSWAQHTHDRALAAGLTSFLTTWATGGHHASEANREQVIDESTSFLWWQMNMQGAAR